jgi:hypothetical protein
MIVNPQLFNYRLIIGSLVVVLAVLGVFAYSNYESGMAHEELLKQEISLIENERVALFTRYKELTKDYSSIEEQLVSAKQEAKVDSYSASLLESNKSVITSLKEQKEALKLQNESLSSKVDSLTIAFKNSQSDKPKIKSSSKTENFLNQLAKTNDSLSSIIKEYSVLKASIVTANAYKIKSDKKEFTNIAKRAKGIEVCITLPENPLVERGKKEIYVQIVSPTGNVLADKGEITFGASSLIYSKREVVDYNSQGLKICAEIKEENGGKSLLKGHYFINVFNSDEKLGGTSIELK